MKVRLLKKCRKDTKIVQHKDLSYSYMKWDSIKGWMELTRDSDINVPLKCMHNHMKEYLKSNFSSMVDQLKQILP